MFAPSAVACLADFLIILLEFLGSVSASLSSSDTLFPESCCTGSPRRFFLSFEFGFPRWSCWRLAAKPFLSTALDLS
uniref:Secreted protein n=1 Tax=Peronospora matthiolae TaxID=2874970 RepID=A0AAV1UNP7_9STRA